MSARERLLAAIEATVEHVQDEGWQPVDVMNPKRLPEQLVDGVIAAGFGDVAIAKAEAFDEAVAVCQRIQDDARFPESGPGVVAAKITLRGMAAAYRGTDAAPTPDMAGTPEPAWELTVTAPKPGMQSPEWRGEMLIPDNGGLAVIFRPTREALIEAARKLKDAHLNPPAPDVVMI